MPNTLYHNPRCSKSREAKALLDDKGVDYQVRLYLNEPLNQDELAQLIRQMNEPLSALIRTKEAEYKESGLSKESDQEAIIEALAQYPKLLERPILATAKGVRIGRPPERILEIL